MLPWVSAATLPTVMVTAETSMSSGGQSITPVRSHAPMPGTAKDPKKKRSMTAKPATLGPTERSAATGGGAPGEGAVEQREPVEHGPGRGGAEEQVLERGLVRHPVALEEGHHDVGRDRHHLEGQIEHHEVVGGGEEEIRERQREDEGMELALAEAVELARVAEGEGEDDQ